MVSLLFRKKYSLFIEDMWFKATGDCSVVLNDAQWEDEGVYTCTYFALPEYNSWVTGYATHRTLLIVEDSIAIHPSTEVERIGEGNTTATGFPADSERMIFITSTLVATISTSIPTTVPIYN